MPDAGRASRTIGSALLWSPFYAAADLVTRVAGGPADGFSRPYVSAVAYGSAFYGFAAILLSIAAARRIAGPGLLAGIVIWLGTPLLFYMYVSPPYSHACSAFAVALFVTIWLHVREELDRRRRHRARPLRRARWPWCASRTRSWRWTGGGFRLDSCRGDSVSIYQSSWGPTRARAATSRGARAAGAADTATGINERPSGTTRLARAIPVAATGCFAFAVGLLPQLLAYKALNGRFGPSTLVTRKMNWQAPHALDVLLSPEHGFFLWTPLAALAIGGLVVLAVRGPAHVRRIGWCALLMVALQIYVSGERRVVDRGGSVRPAPVRCADDPADHWAGRADCRRPARRLAAGARRGARRQRVVERGAHRGVRHRTDESTAARARGRMRTMRS